MTLILMCVFKTNLLYLSKCLWDWSTTYETQDANTSREGIIIEWPLFHLFHDVCEVIITSRNDVRGMNNDEDDNEVSIFTIKRR